MDLRLLFALCLIGHSPRAADPLPSLPPGRADIAKFKLQGGADTSVRFEATLSKNKFEHEMHVYAGMTHPQISADATMLERIHAWYEKHGVQAK